MTAIARTIIKLGHQKRLFIDDVFLLLAVASLCAAVDVMFISFPSMHLLEVFFTEILSPKISSDDIEKKAQYRNIDQGCLVLCLTTIFAVKFSFLFFFRTLIRRLSSMILYWRVISVITALAWVLAISIPFIPCNDCDGNSKISQIRRRGYASIIPDIITNVLSSYSLLNLLPSMTLSPKLTLSLFSRSHPHILDTSDSNWLSSKIRPGAFPMPFNHDDQRFRHFFVHF